MERLNKNETMNTFEFIQSENYRKNIQNSKYPETCVVCGKGIKDIDSSKYVHMNTDWKVVKSDISEEDCMRLTGAESQGCFPIGNDCAKKIPKNFIIN